MKRMPLINNVFRYGICKRLKRGIKINLSPSWRCNLQCEYCILKTSGKKKYPQDHDEIKPIEYWKEWISTFPVKIREVAISGGEPTLIPYLIELVNWLLSEGYYVLILTNLTNWTNLCYIKPSRRLRIEATLHECYDKDLFLEHYNIVSIWHRVDVIEIEKKELSFSKTVPWSSEETSRRIDKNYLKAAPDGTIYRNCFERNEAFK